MSVNMLSDKKHRTLFSGTGLVLTGAFLLISVAVISAFPRLRIDLTQDDLYTLADGTRHIVSGLEKPVEILFFYSEEATADVPQLRTYGTRVQELLREMEIASEGMLTLRVVDPVPFSEDEDLAGEYGVQPVPLTQGGESVFFGVVVLDPATIPAADESGAQAPQSAAEAAIAPKVFETIPLIRPDQEEFLEYEFSKLITQVANPELPIVGFLSGLPIDGGVNQQTMQPTEPWMFMDSVRQLYQVQRVDPEAESIDEAIDILLLVHPQELSEQMLYAIDQHVLRGGKAMVFLDPNAYSTAIRGPDGIPTIENGASDLQPLLAAWGVEYDSTKVLTDAEQALLVNVGDASRPIAHYGMLGIQRASMANDIVNTGLQVMNFSTAGALAPIEGAGSVFEPLVQSSSRSMLMDGALFNALGDPSILVDDFVSADQPHTLAARITGRVQTAFPNGRPVVAEPAVAPADAAADATADGAAAALAAAAEPAAALESAPHLTESTGPVNLLIVADTDFLSDRMWVQIQNFLGQRIPQPFANNGDFMMNALDNLAGNPELVTIRSRGRFARPFLTVLDLQREADDRLREEERVLMDSLKETEMQIAALNANREGNEILPEQQAEIDRFYEQQLETRRRLREVQLELNQDIERLGAMLKFINTALVPILLIIIALLLGYARGRKRDAAAALVGAYPKGIKACPR
ncbi:MAG: GldG family protein [Gammaproteobacteria bacterium]|nr:GldG family protein [Gammaproteobacteria bacterium]